MKRFVCLLWLAIIFLSSMWLTSCGSAGAKSQDQRQDQGPPPPPAKPTVTLTADPTTISGDESSAHLAWTSTNATSVSIGPNIGAVETSGALDVQPADTTTFTATATGPGGTSDPVSVTVTVAKELDLLFQGNPAIVTPGQAAQLTWSTKGALSLSIDNGIGSVTPVSSGSVSVSPTTTTTYTATVNGTNSQLTTSQVTITVQPVVLNLTPGAACIAAGQSTTLSWSSQGAASITIDNGIGAVTAPSGAVTVSPTSTTTYTATAVDSNNDPPVTAQATVQVGICGGAKQLKHIIFMVQENRSFDSYFGRLGLYKAAHGFSNDIDGFDPDKGLPDTATPPNLIKPYHFRTVCTEFVTPSWNESHSDVHWSASANAYLQDQTPMEGFLRTTHSVPHLYDETGERAMGYYDERDLPYYYELATQYATSDRFFSPVLASTIPNRMYLFTSSSFGFIRPEAIDHPPYAQKTIFRALTEAGITWRYYFQDNSVFLSQFADWSTEQGKVRHISEYFSILGGSDADSRLPQVIFIERASQLGKGLDEHPGARYGVQSGAKQVKQIIDALMHSAAWPSSAFILTYDEAGGFHDHVPPITVTAPDSTPPNLRSTDHPGSFTQSGMRIPITVISPFAKPHYTSHVPMDSTAILKLIESRFNVPVLTNRDAAGNDMSDFFDFVSPPRVTLPALPEQPAINPDMGWNDPGSAVCDRTLESDPDQPQ